MRTWNAAVFLLAMLSATRAGHAQEAVSRAAAVAGALERSPRVALARVDSAAAYAALIRARQYDNPELDLSYTKDTPQRHVALATPLDFFWLRTTRVNAAQARFDAAMMRAVFERESVVLNIDTTYTQALAGATRAQLSRGTAKDADSVLVLTRIRRDAGDASELDLELAALNAGQAANAAAIDSLDAITALLALRIATGRDAIGGPITLTDTLAPAAIAALAPPGTSLLVTAAEQESRAAEMSIALERRMRFMTPTFTIGFDTHDPGGQGNQLLPVVGLTLPLPLFNRNKGAVMEAQAERDRARAQLSQARFDAMLALANAQNTYAMAQARATRSRQLVDRANRVSALSLLGYREGATPLTSVLEAQRLSRENLAQYVADVAAAHNAASVLQFLDRTSSLPNANRPR